MRIRLVSTLLTTALLSSIACAQQAPRPQTEMEKKGVAYLLTQQDKQGAWLPEVGPAITALAVKGLVQSGKPLDDPAVVKALAYIETTRQPDGGYYKDSNPNYNSAIVLSMFATLRKAAQDKAIAQGKPENVEAVYAKRISDLQVFLKSLQLDEHMDAQTGRPLGSNGTPITKSNSWYGGQGYGSDGRPDLSNTSFFLEALHDSGVQGTDPAMRKALVFISRSQMNGATNDQDFAKGVSDGGFIYTPAEGGFSKFGDIDNLDGSSTLRSYGTMTYSGFMSLLYAGLDENDPRVRAAVKWISSNWSLERNPGAGGSYDGQYYYMHVFGRAMQAYKHDEITDAKGVKHDWRNELNAFLAKAQQPDGSYKNTDSPRWFEGQPALATSFAVLALEAARQ